MAQTPTISPKTQTAGFMIFTSLMVFILTVVILSLFLNRFEITSGSETVPTRRIQDLVALLQQAEAKKATLESEVNQLQKQSTSSSKKPSAVSPDVKRLYALAGFTPVTGIGIEITLTDDKNKASTDDPHADPNFGKLQAEDLLKLINELKSAGAKAISINDQRLIVTSEIIAAGPTITVNQTRLNQPVVVRALGDPETMTNALRIRGGILEYLDFFNIKVTLEKQKKLTVPAYKGPVVS